MPTNLADLMPIDSWHLYFPSHLGLCDGSTIVTTRRLGLKCPTGFPSDSWIVLRRMLSATGIATDLVLSEVLGQINSETYLVFRSWGVHCGTEDDFRPIYRRPANILPSPRITLEIDYTAAFLVERLRNLSQLFGASPIELVHCRESELFGIRLTAEDGLSALLLSYT